MISTSRGTPKAFITIIVILRPEEPILYLMVRAGEEANPKWRDLPAQIGWVPKRFTRSSVWQSIEVEEGIPRHISGLSYRLREVHPDQCDLWEYLDHLKGCLDTNGLAYVQILLEEGEEIEYQDIEEEMSLIGPWLGPCSGKPYYEWKTKNGLVYLGLD